MRYIIATYNGPKCHDAITKRARSHACPAPGDVLTSHLEALDGLEHNCNVTVSVAQYQGEGNQSDYYKNITNRDTIECENYAYSLGQWLNAYEKLPRDDYYMFIEDDYCFSVDNFDKKLVETYTKKFPTNIGLLCACVEGGPGTQNVTHFEGFVLVSRKTMEQLYTRVPNPRSRLNCVEKYYNWPYRFGSYKYKGGYYQLAFSHLFTMAGVEHDDIMDTNKMVYWSDHNGFRFYKTRTSDVAKLDINAVNSRIFTPIQLCRPEFTSHYFGIRNVIFIVGMHRCGTSFLTSTFVEGGYTVGQTVNKDKDWQNPRGYFENDAFTKFHNNLLARNGKSWSTIRNQCVYTDNDVAQYRLLIEHEFGNSKNCIIKDPRLTFMLPFIQEVCMDTMFCSIVFATRDRTECVKSLCKAQKLGVDTAEDLYDASHKQVDRANCRIVDYKHTRETSSLYDPELYREK